MKKTLLSILLCFVLVMTMAVAVFAEETTETQPAETVHSHCVCGGSAEGVHETHACVDTTWTPLSEALAAVELTMETADFGKLPTGNYYLDGDVVVTAASDIQGKTLSICLNGKSISTTANTVFGRYLQTGTTLNICDCSGKLVNGVWSWDGTVTSGNSNFGGIIWSDDGSEVNLFGGNLQGNGTKHARRAGLVYVSGKTLANAYTGASEFNFYNGVISGGKAGQGGNIFINCKAVMNMYGGTVADGKASYIVNGSTTYNGHGGNVMIDSTATLNMYGGKITNGEAIVNGNGKNRGCGGNLAVSGVFNMFGGEVSNGKASTNSVAKYASEDSTVYDAYTHNLSGCGGNIVSFWKNGRINIKGGCIFGGQANGLYGGNIYMNENAECQLNITGGKIWGGAANADKDEANTAALCYGSDVKGGSIAVLKGTFTMSGGSIGIDENGNAAGGTVYPAGAYGGNVYLSVNSVSCSITGGTIANGNAGVGGNVSGTGYTIGGNAVITGGMASEGGNVYVGSGETVTITGGTFANGVASDFGGNFYNVGTLSISGATISDGIATNTAKTNARGGNIGNKGTLTITDSTISGGQAWHGGSIHQNGGTLTMTGTTVSGGHADLNLDGKGNGTGGNIFFAAGTSTITGCTITEGVAFNGGNLGMQAKATVSGTTISDGEATKTGGNIFFYSNGNLTLNEESSVSGGNANNGGNVGMAHSSAVLTCENVTFEDGTVDTKVGYGGSIYVAFGNATLTNVTVTGGNAQYGGALAVGANGTCSVKESTVETSTGNNGRAAYIAKGGQLTVEDSALKNPVTTSGTCIWNCGTLTLVGTVTLNKDGHVGSDIMLDNRNSATAVLEISGLTGQNEPFVFRRWGSTATDTAGLVANGATQEQVAMFNSWSKEHYVSYADGCLYLNDAVIKGVKANGGSVQGFASFEEAMATDNEDITWFKLLADQADKTISENVIIDLNGFDLTNLTLAEGVVLTGIDSATDTYSNEAEYGIVTLSAENKGTVAALVKTEKAQIGSVKRYMTITTDEGISFHRFYMGITHMSLKPGITGVGYKAAFYGDELVLNQVKSYGYNLWLADNDKVTASKEGAFESGKALKLCLKNFDVEKYGTADVNAEVFLELKDGTMLTSAAYSYTLKGLVEKIAEDVSGFTAEQMSALQTMCQNNADAMADWQIDSILNWTAAEAN